MLIKQDLTTTYISSTMGKKLKYFWINNNNIDGNLFAKVTNYNTLYNNIIIIKHYKKTGLGDSKEEDEYYEIAGLANSNNRIINLVAVAKIPKR